MAAIGQVSVAHSERVLEVEWRRGGKSPYPFVWLRDSCLCPECYHASAVNRLIPYSQLDTKVEVLHAEVDREGKQLTIQWSDSHRSVFDADWLAPRTFEPQAQLDRIRECDPPKQEWDGTFKIPSFNFDQILANDKSLYECLTSLQLTGLVTLNGCPHDEPYKAIEALSARACGSNIHVTHYRRITVVETGDDPSNITYSSVPILLHTDQPYRRYCPNIQLLYCFRQCLKGGASELSDGFRAARMLKQQNPEAYKVLTTTIVDYHDIGNYDYNFHMKTRRPVIDTNKDGDVIGVYYNYMARDYTCNIPLRMVQPFYEALVEFDKILYANTVVYRMEAGDMVVFDNNRTLHARQPILEERKGENRRLELGHWFWDDIRSKIHVLRKQLKTA